MPFYGTEQVSEKCPVFSHVKIDSFQKIANQYHVRNLGTRNIISISISFFFLNAPNNFDFHECPSPVGGQSLPHLLYCDITSGDYLDACHHTGGFSLAVGASAECVDLQGSACWRGIHRHVSNPYL